MLRYILTRALIALPTLLVIVTISFFMMRMAPGGPFDLSVPLPQQVRTVLEANYGLHDPLIVQYLRYLGGLLRGDLGPSFSRPGFTVAQLIGAGIPVSMMLGGIAMAIALCIGVPLGVIAAFRQNSKLDHLLMGAAMTGIAVPRFVMAPILSLVFGVYLKILPAGGWGGGAAANLVLPITTLCLPVIAYLARLTRGSMVEVLNQDFILMARAKGIPTRRILMRHALTPALIPVISFLGPATAALMAGSVVVEHIFALPGMGTYFVDGAMNRDYFLVLGAVITFASILIVLNFLVDLAYIALDPQIRAEYKS